MLFNCNILEENMLSFCGTMKNRMDKNLFRVTKIIYGCESDIVKRNIEGYETI